MSADDTDDGIKRLDEATWNEYQKLGDQADRLAQFICESLEIGSIVNDDVVFPYTAWDECTASGYIILNDSAALTVVAPRALEIVIGRSKPLEDVKQSVDPAVQQIMQGAAPTRRPFRWWNSKTFEIEFEGVVFRVSYADHIEGNVSAVIENLYADYDAFPRFPCVQQAE